MAVERFGLARSSVMGRFVYGTITLMSVLIVYDGWQSLRAWDVIVVIVGPVLAMFLSHVFAAVIAEQAALGRPLVWSERGRITRSESRFLLLAVPPVALVAILTRLGVSLSASIRVVVLIGALSMGLWAGLAGRRSGMTRWKLVLAICAGLLVGALILALQVFLQPGQAAAV